MLHFLDGVRFRFCVPTDLRGQLLETCHDSPLGGQVGTKKFKYTMMTKFYFHDNVSDMSDLCMCSVYTVKLQEEGKSFFLFLYSSPHLYWSSDDVRGEFIVSRAMTSQA